MGFSAGVLRAGVLLSCFAFQSSRGGALLKILILFTKLWCCQEGHFVIKYCHILYLRNGKIRFLTELGLKATQTFKVKISRTVELDLAEDLARP